MKRLEFVRSWQRWKPGDVVEREDGVANLLLKRGICVEAGEATAADTPAGLEVAASRTPAGERYAKRRK